MTLLGRLRDTGACNFREAMCKLSAGGSLGCLTHNDVTTVEDESVILNEDNGVVIIDYQHLVTVGDDEQLIVEHIKDDYGVC